MGYGVKHGALAPALLTAAGGCDMTHIGQPPGTLAATAGAVILPGWSQA